MFHVKQSTVIVVGGGHAGVEAASAAARMGTRTYLVTLRADTVGALSCNPAVGGLGKGHLVREVDAFGGIIGRAADRAGIQFRLLNRSKGPAVQGPRTQVDRGEYRAVIQNAISALPVQLVEGQVADLLVRDGRVSGVLLDDGAELPGDAVILTTGTFLNGVIHMGGETTSGGRLGESPSVQLADRLYGQGLPMGRLKTGTPPRLSGKSIDWSGLELQPGDENPAMMSFQSTGPHLPQVNCAITHTNEHTHDIIRRNLHLSAMYSGNISGKGPRYCPSIEDKISRFADKKSHQIFLEPETLVGETIYPNGVSTSLPRDVQIAYIRSIRGLENAEISQPGYAIEYDYVDPRALTAELEVRDMPGLWLAGQINGTTGYEEAAAQGLVAGLNAASSVQELPPVQFSRTESYIGVMIDDLVIRGVSEPYRMFTSRAEYRLSLRADNADQRLTPKAIELGILDARQRTFFENKMEQIDDARQKMKSVSVAGKTAREAGVNVAGDGKKRDLYALLSIPNVGVSTILSLSPDLAQFDDSILRQLENEATYSNYLDRQVQEVSRVRRHEGLTIPPDFNYQDIQGLSSELRHKLSIVRPTSIAQAERVEGMTPVALNTLIYRLKISRIDSVRVG